MSFTHPEMFLHPRIKNGRVSLRPKLTFACSRISVSEPECGTMGGYQSGNVVEGIGQIRPIVGQCLMPLTAPLRAA